MDLAAGVRNQEERLHMVDKRCDYISLELMEIEQVNTSNTHSSRCDMACPGSPNEVPLQRSLRLFLSWPGTRRCSFDFAK